MSTDNYREALSQVLRLTPDEQLQLLEFLSSIIRDRGITKPRHSIMELEGLGKEVWQGIDVEKYIEEERNSWE
jgi:hypothetical protein